MEDPKKMLDAMAQVQSQPQILGKIEVLLVGGPGGSIQVVVNSSCPDVFQALGLLEVGKQNLMAQASHPAGSKLVRAQGNVPRNG